MSIQRTTELHNFSFHAPCDMNPGMHPGFTYKGQIEVRLSDLESPIRRNDQVGLQQIEDRLQLHVLSWRYSP